MAIVRLNHTSGASSDDNNVTSGTIDASAADLILIAIASYNAVGAPTPTDNVGGNTYNALTVQQVSIPRIQLFWCKPASVSAAMNWSVATSGGFPGIYVAIYSGSHATPFDQESGTSRVGTIQQPGSLTPSEDNCLLFVGASVYVASGSVPTIDSSFNRTDGDVNDGHHFTAAAFDKIQTTAGAENPQVSTDGTEIASAVAMAVFKAAAAASSAIKTIDGLAYASVKTRNSLAIASMKTLDGLA